MDLLKTNLEWLSIFLTKFGTDSTLSSQYSACLSCVCYFRFLLIESFLEICYRSGWVKEVCILFHHCGKLPAISRIYQLSFRISAYAHLCVVLNCHSCHCHQDDTIQQGKNRTLPSWLNITSVIVPTIRSITTLHHCKMAIQFLIYWLHASMWIFFICRNKPTKEAVASKGQAKDL